MARAKLDLRDVRTAFINDPRVLVRFVNNVSGHAEGFEVTANGPPVVLQVELAPGSLYRLEITPSRYSPALRALFAVSVTVTLIHRASEWVPLATAQSRKSPGGRNVTAHRRVTQMNAARWSLPAG